MNQDFLICITEKIAANPVLCKLIAQRASMVMGVDIKYRTVTLGMQMNELLNLLSSARLLLTSLSYSGLFMIDLIHKLASPTGIVLISGFNRDDGRDILKLVDNDCGSHFNYDKLLEFIRSYNPPNKVSQISGPDIRLIFDSTIKSHIVFASQNSAHGTIKNVHGIDTYDALIARHYPEPSTEFTPVAEDGVDVFVSYSRSDLSIVAQLVGALENAGLKVWWDGNLSGGEIFSERISKALHSARLVVVVWSRTSIESAWVRDEADVGLRVGHLFPLSIEGAIPPLGFRQVQTLKLEASDGALELALDRLAAAISTAVARG